MKGLFRCAIALLALCVFVFADGVGNGSNWKGGGHEIGVSLEAQTSGNYRVTFEDADGNEGSTDWGTPDPNGGCSDCPTVSVDGTFFRIKNGIVEREDDGEWFKMNEVKSPCTISGWSTDNEGVGTLPAEAI